MPYLQTWCRWYKSVASCRACALESNSQKEFNLFRTNSHQNVAHVKTLLVWRLPRLNKGSDRVSLAGKPWLTGTENYTGYAKLKTTQKLQKESAEKGVKEGLGKRSHRHREGERAVRKERGWRGRMLQNKKRRQAMTTDKANIFASVTSNGQKSIPVWK